MLVSASSSRASTLIEATGDDPAAVARVIFEDLAGGRFAAVAARMDRAMTAGLPEAKLRDLWEGLVAGLGPLKGADEISLEPREGYVVAVVPLAFENRTVDLRLSIRRATIAGLHLVPHKAPASAWTMPNYADAAKYHEVEVAVGDAPKALPGTLTLPNAAAPVPVAILIHGSGPQDRDQSQGPNRPFRDLAAGLASRGIAALRFEKRTRMFPADFAADPHPTVKGETLDDAALAIALVKSRSEIDPKRIVILGHSLGATLAPRIAALNSDVAAIVMLAAARPLPSIALEQTQYLIELNGGPNAAQKQAIEDLKAEVARVEAARPGDEGAPFMGAALSYWADLSVYDPVAAAAALQIPMLALNGGRDYQVSRASYDRFEAALADHRGAKTVLFPALNHLFMAGDGPPNPTEYDLPRHVDAAVIDAIADFIRGL